MANGTRNRGNGAREALIEISRELVTDASPGEHERWTDWMLATLWTRGYVLVPLDRTEANEERCLH